MTALPPCHRCGSTRGRAQFRWPDGPVYCWECVPPRSTLVAHGLLDGDGIPVDAPEASAETWRVDL